MKSELTAALEDARKHYKEAANHRKAFTQTSDPIESQAFAYAIGKFRKARTQALRIAIAKGPAFETTAWKALDELTNVRAAA